MNYTFNCRALEFHKCLFTFTLEKDLEPVDRERSEDTQKSFPFPLHSIESAISI